jgi:hypothetical protein
MFDFGFGFFGKKRTPRDWAQADKIQKLVDKWAETSTIVDPNEAMTIEKRVDQMVSVHHLDLPRFAMLLKRDFFAAHLRAAIRDANNPPL